MQVKGLEGRYVYVGKRVKGAGWSQCVMKGLEVVKDKDVSNKTIKIME